MGKEGLNSLLKDYKQKYLDDFVMRTGMDEHYYQDKMKGQEQRIKSYYADWILLDSDDFARMMVLDGAFIIELLLKNFLDEFVDDLIFGKPHLITEIWPDLCMLENQVPFFV